MMFSCRLIVGLAFVSSSIVQAGATIDVIPAESGPYSPGQSLTMDIFLTQEPGGSYRGLRGVQFAFTDTDPALQLDPRFDFDYSTVENGGANYAEFSGLLMFPDLPISSTVNLALNYPNGNPFGPFEGVGWSSAMLVLPPEAPLHIGSIGVTLPSQPGEYVLDVMDAGSAGPNPDPFPFDRTAFLIFGFGQPDDPRINWGPASLDQLAGGVFTASDTAGAGFTFGYTPVSGVIVPEPTTLLLVGMAALGMIPRRRGTRCVRR